MALNTSVSLKENNETELIETEDRDEVLTTPEELEAFTAAKLILKDTISLERIFYRDNKSYFNILIDNSIRKWILRLFISNNGMKIVLNNISKTVIEIDSPLDLTIHKEAIVDVAKQFI